MTLDRYKLVAVKPLPEEEALAKGANFLSEVFIFTVAGIAITLEVYLGELYLAHFPRFGDLIIKVQSKQRQPKRKKKQKTKF